MAYSIFRSSQPSYSGLPMRIALFDLDGTLITSKRGKRWAADNDDWIFQGDVPGVLQRCATEGWRVAIVTNQSEWTKSDAPRAKIQSVLDALLLANAWVPWCLVSTGSTRDTTYRKPARGLYDILLKELGVAEDAVAELLMCGDAAGPDALSPEYRWADSDAAFARTIGASFKTPEEIFGRMSAISSAGVHGQEIVILMGNMGSGKSTSGKNLADHGYVHLEQDVLGSARAVLREAHLAAAAKKSVVVDASHATALSREPYIALAKAHGIRYRILWHIRDGRPYNALRPHPVPEVAYAVYSKRFEDPRLDDSAAGHVTMIY